MNAYRRIYETNKRLDQIFIRQYENIQNFYEYNCIGMLVELGEFFKFSKEGIIEAIDKKHRIIEERLSTDY